MNTSQLFLPVLLLIFNRLETTKQVFATIRKAQPPRLYVAADGARASYQGEKDKVQAVRDYVIDNIDWNCDVKTLFRDENLGCKYAVSGAIDWFFKNEEMGIILEDDTLPSQSFFFFCQELLNKYRNDERIMKIAGFNEIEGFKQGDSSYIFTNFGSDWGWASWRRAWANYDVEMSDWLKLKEMKMDNNYPFFKRRNKILEKTYNNKVDTWDYQWHYAINKNHGLVCVSINSLVKNIGFGKEATHTQKVNHHRFKIERNEIEFPLIHPPFVFPDLKYDNLLLERSSAKSMKKKILVKISNFFLLIKNYFRKD